MLGGNASGYWRTRVPLRWLLVGVTYHVTVVDLDLAKYLV